MPLFLDRPPLRLLALPPRPLLALPPRPLPLLALPPRLLPPLLPPRDPLLVMPLFLDRPPLRLCFLDFFDGVPLPYLIFLAFPRRPPLFAFLPRPLLPFFAASTLSTSALTASASSSAFAFALSSSSSAFAFALSSFSAATGFALSSLSTLSGLLVLISSSGGLVSLVSGGSSHSLSCASATLLCLHSSSVRSSGSSGELGSELLDPLHDWKA